MQSDIVSTWQEYSYKALTKQALQVLSLMKLPLVGMALALVASKEINMEWISVNDRLPINKKEEMQTDYHSEDVLVYDGIEVSVCDFSAGRSINFWTNFIHNDKVTHWMPLPQPPKGD
jgi:hypothetical protein